MPTARPVPARGPLRGVRAATFAAAALALAATAHVAGGGSLPAWPALALLVVPLAWGAVALTGRRRGRTGLLLALGVAQLALHEAFMVLRGRCAPLRRFAATMAGMPGMGWVGPPVLGTQRINAGDARFTSAGRIGGPCSSRTSPRRSPPHSCSRTESGLLHHAFRPAARIAAALGARARRAGPGPAAPAA